MGTFFAASVLGPLGVKTSKAPDAKGGRDVPHRCSLSRDGAGPHPHPPGPTAALLKSSAFFHRSAFRFRRLHGAQWARRRPCEALSGEFKAQGCDIPFEFRKCQDNFEQYIEIEFKTL